MRIELVSNYSGASSGSGVPLPLVRGEIDKKIERDKILNFLFKNFHEGFSLEASVSEFSGITAALPPEENHSSVHWLQGLIPIDHNEFYSIYIFAGKNNSTNLIDSIYEAYLVKVNFYTLSITKLVQLDDIFDVTSGVSISIFPRYLFNSYSNLFIDTKGNINLITSKGDWLIFPSEDLENFRRISLISNLGFNSSNMFFTSYFSWSDKQIAVFAIRSGTTIIDAKRFTTEQSETNSITITIDSGSQNYINSVFSYSDKYTISVDGKGTFVGNWSDSTFSILSSTEYYFNHVGSRIFTRDFYYDLASDSLVNIQLEYPPIISGREVYSFTNLNEILKLNEDGKILERYKLPDVFIGDFYQDYKIVTYIVHEEAVVLSVGDGKVQLTKAPNISGVSTSRRFLELYLPSNDDFGAFRNNTELEKYIIGNITTNTYGLLPTDKGFVPIPRTTSISGGSELVKVYDYFILDNKLYLLGATNNGEGIIVFDDLLNANPSVLYQVRGVLPNFDPNLNDGQEKFWYISAGELKNSSVIYLVWRNSDNNSLMIGNLFNASNDIEVIPLFEDILGVNTHKSFYNSTSNIYPIHVFGRFNLASIKADLSFYYSYHYEDWSEQVDTLASYASMPSSGVASWFARYEYVIGFVDEERLTFSPNDITGFQDFLSPIYSFIPSQGEIIEATYSVSDYSVIIYSNDSIITRSIVISASGIVSERQYDHFPVKQIRPVKYFNNRPMAIVIVEDNGEDKAILMEL